MSLFILVWADWECRWFGGFGFTRTHFFLLKYPTHMHQHMQFLLIMVWLPSIYTKLRANETQRLAKAQFCLFIANLIRKINICGMPFIWHTNIGFFMLVKVCFVLFYTKTNTNFVWYSWIWWKYENLAEKCWPHNLSLDMYLLCCINNKNDIRIIKLYSHLY